MTPSRLLLAAALAAPMPAAAQDDRTLVISLWGFNGDLIEEHVLAPFREAHDVEIVLETGNNADRLNKVRIRGGEEVDLIYLTDAFSQTGIENGLFLPVDRSLVPNVEGLHEVAQAPQGEYGPAYTVGRIGIVYDAAKVEPIDEWADLWREDLAGEVAIPEISTTGGPLMVLAAAKVAGVDPYEDTDAAFEKLAEIEPNVAKVYRTGSELINLFSTGEASVGITQDFVLASLREAVPTIEFAELQDGGYAVFNTINIVEGTENADLAHAFIDWALDPELQRTLAVEGVDAPIVASVDLSPEEAAPWTYGAEQIASLNRIDYAKLNAAKDEWADRWVEVFGQ